ncbi:hypothetical protein [Paenibacillus xylanexedens]|uniref:hypothetical protein n=1 Tax=Paenibacillus xylanexedens TaxID=528191 RepID=UPI0011A747C9|nr:hypothetical protein [Paenibacillus xylanexedens]
MKNYGKILLTAIMISSLYSTVAAASSEGQDLSTNTPEIMINNEISQTSTIGIFDPNFKEKAISQGLDSETIIAGYYVPFDKTRSNLSSDQVLPSALGDVYLKNIDMTQITGNVIERAVGKGPAPLSLSVVDGVATTFSAEISSKAGLGGAEIAAKLGTTYQATRNFNKTYGPIQIPANKTYTIYCAPTYNYYSFQIWKQGFFSDSYIGTYEYKEPTGLYFYWQDTTGW